MWRDGARQKKKRRGMCKAGCRASTLALLRLSPVAMATGQQIHLLPGDGSDMGGLFLHKENNSCPVIHCSCFPCSSRGREEVKTKQRKQDRTKEKCSLRDS